MRANAQRGEQEWKTVNKEEERVNGDNTINETREKLFCKDRMLFDELREIVQARCYPST